MPLLCYLMTKPLFSFTLFLLLPIFLTTTLFHSPTSNHHSLFHSPTSNHHSLFLSLSSPSSNSSIAADLRVLTRSPHLAGSPANAVAARYVLNSLSAAFPSHSVFYDVLLTLPSYRSLSVSPNSNSHAVSLSLTQLPADGDEDTFTRDVVPTFHAYSPSGMAVGPAVYANYGRREDFDELRRLGVNLMGSVVVARYGKIYRGDIVRNAEREGVLAVVVYSDTADYGGIDSWYPETSRLTPTGVQVGSVYNGQGDPMTPGWASVPGCERRELTQNERRQRPDEFTGIPSIPVSAADAEKIFPWIGGLVADDNWQGKMNVSVYRLGPGPAVLNLTYEANETITKIENVFAVIRGEEEPDRYVLLGNHRDAWTFGAVDPNSGTAALLEVGRRLAKLWKRGWRPRRSIILCNWDAEEYGLIGSTEWVEENREMLHSKSVAYINVDSAVYAPGFYASATPQLDKLLQEVAKEVQDPDNSSRTVYEAWVEGKDEDSPLIGRLGGAGSDFAPFVQHVGVPAIDMSFGKSYPVYHSLYDDYMWMEKFGDPMFLRHAAAASIWGLIALKLADDEILPFDYHDYAYELEMDVKEIEASISNQYVSFTPLHESISKLKIAADSVELRKQELESRGWLSRWTENSAMQVRELNDRLVMAERAFTDRDGLAGRPWYKHLIYAPSKGNDYGSTSFPGIQDAMEEAKTTDSKESWELVQREIWRVARAITQASLVLTGVFT